MSPRWPPARACSSTNNITVISIGSLAAFRVAANKALSTLPATAYILGGALSTYPISLFMRRHGRRAGSTLGALAGATGAAVCTAAVGLHSFWLFCLGTLMAGAYNASGGYYRFAARDISTQQFKKGRRRSRWSWLAACSAASSVPRAASSPRTGCPRHSWAATQPSSGSQSWRC